jgi:hypothetical protein
MSFSGYTLPISLNAVATAGRVTQKSMSGLRGKTVYNFSSTSYTLPASGNFSLKDNLLNRSFTSPANTLKITSETTTFPGAYYPFTDYRADYATSTSSWESIPSNNVTFHMTGGNSSPIYIYYDTSAINGRTAIQLNNVYYDNLGDISVYFPFGIVNANSTHYNAFNGGSMQISQTEPVDKTRARASQDAGGNAIGSPNRY